MRRLTEYLIQTADSPAYRSGNMEGMRHPAVDGKMIRAAGGLRSLIEEADCGRCCDPGDYGAVTTLISDFLQNAGSERCAEMGARGRAYLTAHLTRDLSVTRYAQEILDCGKPKK